MDTKIVQGSSPRMRGTRFKCARQSSTTGIIPAYAGNTPKRRSVAPRSRDHPRVCGEHRPAISKLTRALGSSPRMRGTRYRMVFATPVCGIIPAYAGNTKQCFHHCFIVGDHPRVCGEHAPHATRCAVPMGSSPRMRGTLATVLLSVCLAGIIPAYAGNTDVAGAEFLRHRDHPRVCGEHTAAGTANVTVKGSSPRMRGTRCVVLAFT